MPILLTTDSNGSNRRKRGFPKIHAKITDKGMTNKAILLRVSSRSRPCNCLYQNVSLTILDPTAIVMLMVQIYSCRQKQQQNNVLLWSRKLMNRKAEKRGYMCSPAAFAAIGSRIRPTHSFFNQVHCVVTLSILPTRQSAVTATSYSFMIDSVLHLQSP